MQVRKTLPVNPEPGVSCKLNCAVAPALTEAEVEPEGAAPRLIAGLAVPATSIVCGESGASSVSEMVSLRGPVDSGAKVTEMEHVAVGARGVPEQPDVEFEKSAVLAPPTLTAEICRATVPVFVTTALSVLLLVPCVVAGKFTGLGEMVTAGTGAGEAFPAT